MTQQGSLALLDDPVAQHLLQAPIPAQLAYTWTDGTPRNVAIWFHWDGRQIVLGSPPRAPKIRVLERNPHVALTINEYQFPYKILYVRGTASLQLMDTIVPEYALTAERVMGPNADGWLQQLGAMLPKMGGMVRVAITPEWVAIHDFEQRFPSAVEKAAMALAASA